MSEEGNMLLLGGQAQVKSAVQFSARLALASFMEVTIWQSVSASTQFLWTAYGSLPSFGEADAIATDCGIVFTQNHYLILLQQWENRWDAHSSFSNFVLRAVEPSSVDRLLPQIKMQMEKVSQQSGCQKCILASVVGHRSYLLGVTAWSELEAFEKYKNWASADPWQNVINPVTIDVPLRMLARRLEGTGID
jgi:hypothetical protein